MAIKTFDVTVSFYFAFVYNDATFWVCLLHYIGTVGIKYLLDVVLMMAIVNNALG